MIVHCRTGEHSSPVRHPHQRPTSPTSSNRPARRSNRHTTLEQPSRTPSSWQSGTSSNQRGNRGRFQKPAPARGAYLRGPRRFPDALVPVEQPGRPQPGTVPTGRGQLENSRSARSNSEFLLGSGLHHRGCPGGDLPGETAGSTEVFLECLLHQCSGEVLLGEGSSFFQLSQRTRCDGRVGCCC